MNADDLNSWCIAHNATCKVIPGGMIRIRLEDRHGGYYFDLEYASCTPNNLSRQASEVTPHRYTVLARELATSGGVKA